MGGTRRLLHLSLIAFGCAVLLLAGCSGEDEGTAATETPAATPASLPTGIAEVDAIIDAVERQDVEALRGFVRYQPISCDSPTADGYVIPPTCPEGVLPGTAVDAFLGGSCHPRWMRPVEVADGFAHVQDFPHIAYAVYRTAESFAEIEAEYRVAISAPSEPYPERSAQVGISGGNVVWLVAWCGNVGEQITSLRDAGAEPIYLAPESNTGTPAPPRR